MVLVVVVMHPVPPHQPQVRQGAGQPFADHRQVPDILAVIHRIGFRLPVDHAGLHLVRAADPQRDQFAPAQVEQLGIGPAPHAVRLKAEVLHPQPGQSTIRHHRAAEILEVRDPTHLDARIVHIDPLVREDVGPVKHEIDRNEVAIGERVSGLPHDRGRRRLQLRDQLADRHRADELRSQHVEGRTATIAHDDREHATRGVSHRDHLFARSHRMAGLCQPGRHRLPHLPGSASRVAKGVDQRLDDGALAAPQRRRQDRIANHFHQVQAADPLPGPVGGQLAGRDPPDLLGIGLEKDLEQPMAELVGHPVFERLWVGHRPQPRLGVAGHATCRFNRAQTQKGVRRPDRVIEELPPVQDPGQPRHGPDLITQNLGP